VNETRSAPSRDVTSLMRLREIMSTRVVTIGPKEAASEAWTGKKTPPAIRAAKKIIDLKKLLLMVRPLRIRMLSDDEMLRAMIIPMDLSG
jgi:hypothetical protein